MYEKTSYWHRPEPMSPDDQMVQVNIRMPMWYRNRLLDTAPGYPVATIILDLLSRMVDQDKEKQ